MIGAQIPIPVKKEDDEYIVPVKSRGEVDLSANLTRDMYEQTELLRQIHWQLKLMNERLEAAFNTTIQLEDIYQEET